MDFAIPAFLAIWERDRFLKPFLDAKGSIVDSISFFSYKNFYSR